MSRAFFSHVSVHARRLGFGLLSALVVGAGLTLLPAAPAVATGGGGGSVPNFVCTTNTVYSIDGSEPHTISKINPTTGATSSNGAILPDSSDAINALALPAGGGRYIYAFNRTDNQVIRFDATTQDEDIWNAPSNSSAGSVIAGAINPANGIYYYASGGDPWKLFAFNTNTNTAIGQVGTIGGLEGNGDMAFDAVGNLYVVSNGGFSDAGTLARVNGPLPTTAGSTAFSGTHLATLPDDSGQYASMAFDASGVLVIGTTAGKVLRVNPASGASIGTTTVSLSLADMASCASPSTALARVNLPDGRYDADDQFKVTITGGGVTSGNQGTTAGTDSGLQTQPAEVAGPVVVLPGGTYTITQTATPTADLGDYTTTWQCVLESSGSTIASGTGSTGSFTVPSASGSSVVCTFTNLPLRPAIELDKTGSAIQDLDGNGPDAGDKITYSFTVTNTGNVTLNPVTVSDTKVGAVTCPSGALAPGASVNCTPKAYTITQAEVTAGTVDNTATAEGTAPNGHKVTDPDSVSTPVPAMPGIALDKTAGALNDLDSNGPDAGDTITYSFALTNTGNVPLNPVTVTDPKVGAVTCPAGALAPGATVSCTPKVYTVTLADVNAGKVENTATATGTPPTGGNVTDEDSTTTMLQGAPAIELDKTGSAIQDLDANGPDAGDKITYSFKVTNTGTVSLNPVTVTDPKVGPVTCPSGALAPGASVNCTPVAYTLTQADVTAGKVDNTATAEGTAPNGTKVTDPDSMSTPVPSMPGLALDKTAGALTDVDSNGPDAGDTITYTFKVTNTGNVPLNPVTVSDPKVGPVTCPAGSLAPGAFVNCTPKVYALTQADVNAGEVDNTAVAEGTAPNGTKVTDDDSTSTPIAPDPAIDLVKSGSAINDVNGNGPDAGDTVTYSFTVTNTGNVTLTAVTVSDPKVGPVTCPTGPLAPGATISCTPRLYTITQADVDAGEFANTADVTGTAPDGEVVEDSDTHTVDLPASASIAIDKVAGSLVDVDSNGPDAGDTITFSFTVFNTGALSLSDISVSDPKVGPVTCPETALEPGESMDCDDVTYVVTEADVTAGTVDNTATATGTPPSGPDVSDEDSTSTPVEPVEPSETNIKVVKDVDDATPHVGDTITYTLTVTNDSDADAEDVVLTDHLPDGVTFVSTQNPCTFASGTVTCELGTLAAGDSRSVEVKVKVDPLPQVNTEHQHWIDVQKTEVHVDVEPGQEATGTVTCQPGYVVTDGSGRIDHVDQGTGTFEDVAMTENRAVGTDGWRATFVNDAGGRAQAKVFAVCVKQESESVSGHTHGPVIGDPVTATQALPQGLTEVTLTCAPGHTPVQPGYVFDGVATVLTTYPSGSNAWTWVVDNGGATEGTFSMRCLDNLVSTANGHQHGLKLSEVRQTGTVPAGQSVEFTLTCAGDAKGIVAGYDMDPGLVNQGNDPRPIIRVFKFYNPTDGPLDVRMFLLCLGNRTGGGADGGGTVVNTATGATATTETTTADNSDNAKIEVDASAPVTIVASTVTVTSKAVEAPVQCKKGKTACTGVATLVVAKNQRIGGHLVKKGTVLAKAAFKIKGGKKVVLKLGKTKAGKKALGSLRKAQLKVGGKVRTVTIRR